MNPRQLLAHAISKSAGIPCQPDTNAPAAPKLKSKGLNTPMTNAGGPITPALGGATKTAYVNDFLNKTAAQLKSAAPRPGRLDGDIVLSKLASRHRPRKAK